MSVRMLAGSIGNASVKPSILQGNVSLEADEETISVKELLTGHLGKWLVRQIEFLSSQPEGTTSAKEDMEEKIRLYQEVAETLPLLNIALFRASIDMPINELDVTNAAHAIDGLIQINRETNTKFAESLPAQTAVASEPSEAARVDFWTQLQSDLFNLANAASKKAALVRS